MFITNHSSAPFTLQVFLSVFMTIAGYDEAQEILKDYIFLFSFVLCSQDLKKYHLLGLFGLYRYNIHPIKIQDNSHI